MNNYCQTSIPSFCICLCHKPWYGVIPPQCWCQCGKSTASTKISIEYPEKEKIDKEINELKDFNIAQSGWNNHVIDRIEKLEQSREANSRSNKDLFERIEKLEIKWAHSFEDRKDIRKIMHEIENRLDRIDIKCVEAINLICKRLDELEYKEVKKESEYDIDKKPHKCPVCDGNCMRPNPLTGSKNAMLPVNLDCVVCEGKGIVWG